MVSSSTSCASPNWRKRFQQAVPGPVAGRLRQHHGTFHQPQDGVLHLVGIDAVAGAHLDGGVERETPGEHR